MGRSPKMRLLHVINSLNPKLGGTVAVVRALAGEQCRQGLEVDVLTLDPPGCAWFHRIEAPVIALGPSYLGIFCYNPRLIGWLRENRHNYDAIILHGIWDFTGLGGMYGLRGGPTPWFIFTHGMLDPWFEQFRLKHLKKTVYWKAWAHRILRDADGVVFTAQDEELRASTSFRPYQVNGIVAAMGAPAPDPEEEDAGDSLVRNFPEFAGKRLAVFMGRNHPIKGIDLLIEALSTLSGAYPDLRLVIAGPNDPARDEQVKEHARRLGVLDRVHWVGFISEPLRFFQMTGRAGSIFALPSHSENFGLSVVESLACGQPVAISNKVNIWREIERFHAGLVGADNVEDTTTSLKRFLEMPAAEFAGMQLNARRCFDQCFEISVVTRRLTEALTERILQRKSGKPAQ